MKIRFFIISFFALLITTAPSHAMLVNSSKAIFNTKSFYKSTNYKRSLKKFFPKYSTRHTNNLNISTIAHTFELTTLNNLNINFILADIMRDGEFKEYIKDFAENFGFCEYDLLAHQESNDLYQRYKAILLTNFLSITSNDFLKKVIKVSIKVDDDKAKIELQIDDSINFVDFDINQKLD